MFQAWLVNTAKIAANSAPSTWPGNSARKKVTVKVRKPSTGTDCRMSISGISTISARRLFAAMAPKAKVKTRLTAMAASIRSVVRSA